MVKYYYAGAQRVAMRQGSTLYYLLPDHLGSTSLTTDANGAKLAELRYRTWGETRYNGGNTPTKYQYTGQYSYTADFGLYFYNARWYDPTLGRFAQPDSLIPEQSQGVQAWDRYAYVNNNPLRYNDPSGHAVPLPPSPFASIYVPVSNGWDLVAGAACFVLCTFLPVHFERYGPGQGAIVGDETLKPVLPFITGVQLSPEAAAFNVPAEKAVAEPAQLQSGRWAHEELGQQYLESLPPEQRPYVDIDRTFVDPLTGERFRPDVVNHWTGEVVEFKPNSWQANKYLEQIARQQAESYAKRLTRMYGDWRILEVLPEYRWRVKFYQLK
jgi:RHS repeat-associated protein